MTLSHTVAAVAELPSIPKFLKRLQSKAGRVHVEDVPYSFRPALIAAVVEQVARPTLLVTNRSDRADALCAAMNEFLPPTHQAHVWPAPEALPFEQLPFDLGVGTQRI